MRVGGVEKRGAVWMVARVGEGGGADCQAVGAEVVGGGAGWMVGEGPHGGGGGETP